MGTPALANIFALPIVAALPLDIPSGESPADGKNPGKGGDQFIPSDADKFPPSQGGRWVNPFASPDLIAAAADPFKDTKELLDAITDAKLFGEVLPEFENERSGKYKKVNMALYAVREVLQGGPVKVEFAKAKIEEWLNDYDLLTDLKVATVARINLRDALKRAPNGDDTFNQNVKTILDALVATYTPSPKAEEKPKGEEKKKEEKKEEKKEPAEKEPAKPEAPKEEEKKAPPAVTVKLMVYNYPNTAKGSRKDTTRTLIDKVKPIMNNAYAELLKKFPKAEFKGAMRFIVDNKTGNITKLSFVDIQVLGADKEDPVVEMLQSIADKVSAALSLEKQGSELATEVEWPIDKKPPAS